MDTSSPQDIFALDMNASDTRIMILGLGGAGVNCVQNIDFSAYGTVRVVGLNTDLQSLQQSQLAETFLIGQNCTHGLGTGGNVELGLQASESDRERLYDLIKDQDVLVLVAGLGGGTGSAVTQILAQVAAKTDATVLAFVNHPFSFEGPQRKQVAEQASGDLRQLVHGLFSLPNDLLMQEGAEGSSVIEAFDLANEWIQQAIEALVVLLLKKGVINQDLNALRSVFCDFGGRAFYGVAAGSGADYVAKALEQLTQCPLLHLNQDPYDADQLILHIQAGQDLPLAAVNELVTTISLHFGVSQAVTVSAIFDESLSQSLKMCVLGKRGMQTAKKDTGLPKKSQESPPMSVPAAIAADASSQAPVHKSKLNNKERVLEHQDEFQFIDRDADRGYFVKTDHNEYGGEDLDVPTFMRKGIKIKRS
ncbi:MAG: cell division protein FtsZ [Opitutales bacterium]